MTRVVVFINLTLDGVMQTPGRSDASGPHSLLTMRVLPRRHQVQLVVRW